MTIGRLFRRNHEACSMTPEQKKQNLRLALVLASVAVVLFIGFIARAAIVGF